ncbi:hypothetical protein SLEP1_g19379 [Rubroshorea leprosula]|nr:hypothetical protein SLEP1_g19379 [Rubroshorea leprosula]
MGVPSALIQGSIYKCLTQGQFMAAQEEEEKDTKNLERL